MSFRKWMPRVVIFVGIVVIFFLIVAQFGTPRKTTDAVGYVSQPVRGWFFRFSDAARRIVRLPFEAAQLRREVTDLRGQVRIFAAENTRLAELERENQALRKELSFVEQSKYSVVVAQIIGKVAEGGNIFWIIDRGIDSGITEGLPVLADGIIVGKIVRAHSTMSIFAGLTVPGVKTAAAFAGSTATEGIVEGELNVNLVMRLIPKDVSVRSGIGVITSGLEEKIPRGLVIGFVEKEESDIQELFQTAYLKSPVRIQDISIVSIVQSPARFLPEN